MCFVNLLVVDYYYLVVVAVLVEEVDYLVEVDLLVHYHQLENGMLIHSMLILTDMMATVDRLFQEEAVERVVEEVENFVAVAQHRLLDFPVDRAGNFFGLYLFVDFAVDNMVV